MEEKKHETQDFQQDETQKPNESDALNQSDNKDESDASTEKKSGSTTNENLNEEQRKIIDLNQRLGEANDKFLRIYSEFDNYKKRVSKERIELFKTASEDVIASMLPVYDDFDRALKSMESISDSDPVKEGVLLIFNKFKNILSQKGLTEIATKKGDDFNTDFHEAITQMPAPEEELKGKVVDEIQKGFLLNGKVIRFSKVVVGI